MKIISQTTVLDAADLHASSSFWAGFFGGTVNADDDWHDVLGPDGTRRLAIQLAPDHVPPTWPSNEVPQQAHLDFYVEDWKTAHDEVLALGGRHVEASIDPSAPRGFQVYADPAGHLFCLCWG